MTASHHDPAPGHGQDGRHDPPVRPIAAGGLRESGAEIGFCRCRMGDEVAANAVTVPTNAANDLGDVLLLLA